jgi:TDG/mug DNA glycosylase family protein
MDGLNPLDTPRPRVLVLGSFPSRLSLERGEYYGHPRNHFWPILAAAAGRAIPADYAAKKALAARLGLAIWDLVASCSRPGSLDADIRDARINDIIGFIGARPSIARVALNGGAAAAFFAKTFAPDSGMGTAPIGEVRSWRPAGAGGPALSLCRLPSTSPIPTARFRTAADKFDLWAGFIMAADADIQPRRDHPI